jgi:aliphatic nitrilase
MTSIGNEISKSRPFVAAAVQAAPVYLDPAATALKVADLVREAAAEGARLVAFPEVFIAGYPYWNWVMTPLEGSEWFERLQRSAIDVPGPEVDVVRAAAREAGAVVVVGVNERAPHSLGAIYNTTLTIDADGTLLGVHRKLVPTWAEKLSWAPGDAAGLTVHPTAVGPLGVLACGENTNPLARFALLSQGELIHVAGYISLPVAPPDYDMAAAIRLRGMTHSFEGKVFTVISCSTISEEILDTVAGADAGRRELMSRTHSAYSGVIGPDGTEVGEPLIDAEGIVYAEIDLRRCIQPKQMHDVVGGYNRFDIFDLQVDTRRREPVRLREAFPEGERPEPPAASEESDSEERTSG